LADRARPRGRSAEPVAAAEGFARGGNGRGDGPAGPRDGGATRPGPRPDCPGSAWALRRRGPGGIAGVPPCFPGGARPCPQAGEPRTCLSTGGASTAAGQAQGAQRPWRVAAAWATVLTVAGQHPRGSAWPRAAATRSLWRASMGGPPCGEGHECGDRRVRGIGASAGVALRLSWAPGRLALQLREFAVDRTQTPLTGHVLPRTHHEGAPPVGGPPLATGRLLQVSEPSMDGVRHCGSPSLLSGSHGGGLLPDLPAPDCRGLGPGGALQRAPRGRGAQGERRPRRGTSPSRRCGLQRTLGPSAWRGPAAAQRGAASLPRKIVCCAQETLHA
jgi:hypothetical protein